MAPDNIEHVYHNTSLVSIRMYAEHHDLGRAFVPNVQVRFAAVPSRRIPDLLFVSKSRANIIKGTYIDGAPDLIVEIVSPDSDAGLAGEIRRKAGFANIGLSIRCRSADAHALGRVEEICADSPRCRWSDSSQG